MGAPLAETRQQMKMNTYITRGAPNDYEKLHSFFKGSPTSYYNFLYSNLYEPGDFRRIQNKTNQYGLTPLFLATMNGNLKVRMITIIEKMVKFLIEQNANPYLRSTVDKNHEETILETACRWNYIEIIKYYLDNFEWDYNTLDNSRKLTNSIEARDRKSVV